MVKTSIINKTLLYNTLIWDHLMLKVIQRTQRKSYQKAKCSVLIRKLSVDECLQKMTTSLLFIAFVDQLKQRIFLFRV